MIKKAPKMPDSQEASMEATKREARYSKKALEAMLAGHTAKYRIAINAYLHSGIDSSHFWLVSTALRSASWLADSRMSSSLPPFDDLNAYTSVSPGKCHASELLQASRGIHDAEHPFRID